MRPIYQVAMVKAYDGALVLTDVLLLIFKIVYYICESVFRFLIPREKSVAGEIVLITGTGHGIGKELALRYASLGATVVCWDLNQVSNQETVNEIKNKHQTIEAYAYQCDVSKREEVFSVAERVKKEVGDVTILVNNAGIMPCHAFLDHTTDEIIRIFDINVLAHFWMLQAFLPNMIKRNHGHVVALSSVAGLRGLPNLVPYCASKFAVRGLMESISEELRISTKGRSLIKFTTICPYMVDTGLCKKPKIRFPEAMPLVTPRETASQIVIAQRRDYRERSVPQLWLTLNTMLRNLPDNALCCLIDFLDSGVEADS